MTRKRPTLGDTIKDVAIKLAREAERHVGAGDATICLCDHQRSDHCGCGTVCLAPKDPSDKGKKSYETCGCQGFAPKVEG